MHTKIQRPQFATPATDSKVQKIPYKKSIAVKFLEAMADEAARANNPNTPPEWIAPRRYRDDTANHLTRCIIDFIRLTGNQAERIANTGHRIDTRYTFADVTGRSRTIGSSTIKGRSVKIEVKHGSDRQSEAQRAYQSQVQQAGGIYIVASSFEQFLNWYNEKYVIEPSNTVKL